MTLRYALLALVFWCSSSNSAFSAASWDLNDVSILLPIPSTTKSTTETFFTTDTMSKGPLIPKSVLDLIPSPINTSANHADTLKNMRAVSMRIDPCGQLAKHGTTCTPMIRMVWQPIGERNSSSGVLIEYDDVALHSFYVFSNAEFSAFVKAYLKLKKFHKISTAGLSINVHAGLKNGGFTSAFGKALRALILRNCGEKNLVRMTFMTLSGRGNAWVFGGFQRTDLLLSSTTWEKIGIPKTSNSDLQSVAVTAMPPHHFSGRMFPEAVPDHNVKEVLEFNEFVKDTRTLASPTLSGNQKALIENSAAAALNIENIMDSKIVSSETIDCATCHLAQPVHHLAFKLLPDLAANPPVAAPKFVGTYNLKNESILIGMTNQMRAFGYFTVVPVISQRTIHESAAIADEMNKKFP